MSLYGALYTGVAGLAANSRAMATTSTNIANVNTVGYKDTDTQFSTLLASTATVGTSATGGVKAVALPHKQDAVVVAEGIRRPLDELVQLDLGRDRKSVV